MARPARPVQTALAALGYAALTIVMTWPIARGISHDVPADLGDSLLNMWIMSWMSEGILAIARGAMSISDLWNANIFHPTPLSLTLSEHLFPQTLQGLPAYLATGNILLAYNLVFLGTFALSGLGMFLLVRELTGSARVAFVTGLFYAFLPYRLGQFPHIQTLSSQWMPFALFGFRRYLDTGRWRTLVGGTAAFIVQGLSSGYYLFYFAPVLLLYTVWELAARGRLRDRRAWFALCVAGVVSIACMLPFLLPYAAARAQLGLTRPYAELLVFSANLYAYLNAPPQLYLWGPYLNRYPQPEGDLFLGAVPICAALAAVVIWTARAWHVTRGLLDAESRRRRTLVRWLAWITVAASAVALVIATTGGLVWDAGVLVTATSPKRPIKLVVLAVLAILVASPRPRAAIRALAGDLTPILLVAFVFAVAMSLGPEPRAGERSLVDFGPYGAFYHLVPGFDGLRVPARFGMVAAALLAALAGYGLAPLARWRRGSGLALVSVAFLFLAESYAVPMPVNQTWTSDERYMPAWPTVHRLNDGPLAYRHLLAMPADTIVLELPLGESAWDLRYVYYAGLHGKRIVNGYSGYIPDGYGARVAHLAAFRTAPDEAWQAVTSSGATHLLLHEDAYRSGEWRAVSAWALGKGARQVVQFEDGARLFEVPRN